MSVRILVGDYTDVLAALPAGAAHCVVTSPPYWAQRDYGVPGQLGREAIPDCLGWVTGGRRRVSRWQPCGECYVCHLVEFGRLLWPVLRDDGTLWLVLGDGYFKDKNLVGAPWRVALALQTAGWTLRAAAPWIKVNSMPDPAPDRPGESHEYVFLFSKGPRYFYDAEAVRRPPAPYTRKGGSAPYTAGGAAGHGLGSNSLHQMAESGRHFRTGDFFFDALAAQLEAFQGGGMLTGPDAPIAFNVPTVSFSGAHFAVFPPALIEPMIAAGTSERGCCPECGAPWQRVVAQRPAAVTSPRPFSKAGNVDRNDTGRIYEETVTTTVGWGPGCDCGHAGRDEESDPAWYPHDPVPCTILDPFGGSGTTGLVADRMGRWAILGELNPDYAEMAYTRIREDSPLFATVGLEEARPIVWD